jgi:hypothetical protein
MAAWTSPHSSPFARLMSNVTEDGDCWLGTERERSQYGYVRVNFYIPGLMRRVKLSAHILARVADETGLTNIDELFLAYHEFRCSGLQLDHTCVAPACRRPDHLEPVTASENTQRMHDRRKVLPNIEPAPEEIMF